MGTKPNISKCYMQTNMVEIQLGDRQTGYDAVEKYIMNYWSNRIPDTMIVSLEVSYNGKDYDKVNCVADCSGYCSAVVEFLSDWWEGEKYIRILGMKDLSSIEISGGIYLEQLDKQKERGV